MGKFYIKSTGRCVSVSKKYRMISVLYAHVWTHGIQFYNYKILVYRDDHLSVCVEFEA